MGRAKFGTDIAAASQEAAAGTIAGVSSIKKGPEGDGIIITYRHESIPKAIQIYASAQDTSEYPEGNTYMVYAEDDAPKGVLDAIETAQQSLFGISVSKMVMELSRALQKSFGAPFENEDLDDEDDDDDDDDGVGDFSDDELEDDYDEDGGYSLDNDAFGLTPGYPGSSAPAPMTSKMILLRRRIQHDFRKVKDAGYKVGFVNGLTGTVDSGIVSLSIRVSKLGLSDDVMEAWDVQVDDYFVLLLRYTSYAPLESIVEKPAVFSPVKFRTGKCKRYKPSLQQALAAFSNANKAAGQPQPGLQSHASSSRDTEREFHRIPISNSLDEYMNESFISILKIRKAQQCTWDQANELFKGSIGADNPNATDKNASLDLMEVDPAHEDHQLLAPDHLTEAHTDRSFPLVAMQFAIRSFMRCTDYCVRCHRRMEGIEALRPYVCDRPLCLFQYVSMGFGPSIEHEIVTEPYVVDLLVSLCYAAIQQLFGSNGNPNSFRIRAFPLGLELKVPNLVQPDANLARAQKIGYQLLFSYNHDSTDKLPVFDARYTAGRWIAIRGAGQTVVHGIITDANVATKVITFEPKTQSATNWGVGVHAMYSSSAQNKAVATMAPAPISGEIVDVFPYDTDFDGLSDPDKATTMRHILDTLPSILSIDDHLNKSSRNSVLSMDAVSPAAFRLLQWIVSTNRSCIYQVDRARPSGADTPNGKAGRGRDREHERIEGMEGWVQFRFAQGAPDKELKFNRELEKAANNGWLNKKQPTIFAWHGSNLANWHSIVRTGLDFKDTLFGRAYGNGVYFSPLHGTSLGYTSMGSGTGWPNSDLGFAACMSLNEIIGAPEQFVSRSPHYVVAQPDWHQCRYLFVMTNKIPQTSSAPTSEIVKNIKKPLAKFEKAPKGPERAYHDLSSGYKVTGPVDVLKIPLSAIPFRDIDKKRGAMVTKRTIVFLDDDSEFDDQDDTEFLKSEDISESGEPPFKKHDKSTSAASTPRQSVARPPTPPEVGPALTDFKPGHLNLAMLPRLGAPSFANPMATKALSADIKRMQKLQSTTPLHELGWYMDFEEVTNLFQWIVEFHSFDPSLPLANDMKRLGATSIVFEFRFGKDFPISPPFVRVIRPRFLPFMQGGGGHVTAGGAMCMELLTSTGWSPANSMESVLLQVRLALCSQDPKPARLLDGSGRSDYGVAEAIDAFVRAATAHGWAVPQDLRETANGV
ncbi:hypothetical protein OQA88_12291 [Cercophora sp. LCS_1]